MAALGAVRRKASCLASRAMLPSFDLSCCSGAPRFTRPFRPHGWWDLGHRIVARLADLRLTPHTRDAVRRSWTDSVWTTRPVWADDIKNYRHDADPLHYVNIPCKQHLHPDATLPQGSLHHCRDRA